MDQVIVLGIYVRETPVEAPLLQALLSKYGCCIKTRLGLHTVEENYAGSEGLLLLELDGEPNECERFEEELRKINGIEVQKLCYDRMIPSSCS